ncbi:predicted protein [Histoplasma capsulatum G186AR]|uniref:Uncharacterized protein n=1 Tax=Ajellomyces capsulatus (strain G186AR / H82 / ATCC MYA-2454 / RMSCC 2432) TaxID=447093 RepID=C0NR22_AJECG|nr:uncharacterized protein HCBG_05452 [Histoplasma capsulatum G186AR]EEH06136.1 predicted protein [Histoplasma capsulatum G186AR]
MAGDFSPPSTLQLLARLLRPNHMSERLAKEASSELSVSRASLYLTFLNSESHSATTFSLGHEENCDGNIVISHGACNTSGGEGMRMSRSLMHQRLRLVEPPILQS